MNLSDKYLDAACRVIAAAIDGGKYFDEDAFMDSVARTAHDHVPMFYKWVSSYKIGRDELRRDVANKVKQYCNVTIMLKED